MKSNRAARVYLYSMMCVYETIKYSLDFIQVHVFNNDYNFH